MLRTPRFRRRLEFYVLIAICVIISGCGSAAPSTEEPHVETQALFGEDRIRLIPAPAGRRLTDPLWSPAADELLVTSDPGNPEGSVADVHLEALDLADLSWRRIPLPERDKCKYTSHEDAALLPDGRIAYLERCWGPGVDPRRAVRLMAYDPRSADARPFVPYFLPYRANCHDFSPRDGRGVINDGNGLFERLQWIGEDGLVAIDIPVARAGTPRWSLDGEHIAMDAVPPTDTEGINRVDLTRNIYLLDRDGTIKRTLVEDARNLGLLTWSRDGNYLLVPMEPPDAPAGLYLVDVASGDQQLLVKGKGFGSAAWLPNGGLVVSSGVFDESSRRGLLLIPSAERRIAQALARPS